MFGAIKKIFTKEIIPERRFDRYMELHDTMLGTSAKIDKNIMTHAMNELAGDYTPEEAVMRSALFDVALQVEKARGSVLKLVPLYPDTLNIIKFMTPWREAGKIRISEWERVTTYMYGITLITENQERILAEVLDELRHGLNDIGSGAT
jgi:hypothetical protein